MRRLFIVFLISGSIIIQSCSSIYMPNVPATPMFRNKGEGYVAAHANIKGNVSATAGVAVTEHVAVLASGSIIDNQRSNPRFSQKLGEAALGYYTTMGKQKRQVLEFYAGYGLGKTIDADVRASTTGYDVVESRNLDFDKIFVQVNYSSTRKNKLNLFGGKKELNYGTAIRVSRVQMKDFTVNGLETQKEENLFIEPVFFTRLELNKGFQLQYTSGFNIGVADNAYLKAGNSVFTLGLTYNFGRKK